MQEIVATNAPQRKVDLPSDPLRLKHLEPWQLKSNQIAAYVDQERGWVVQVYSDCDGCDGTPWQGTLRVSVKHSLATTTEDFQDRASSGTITWDDLQNIKDHFWPDQIAIEIYPPKRNIVNVADMRWLWVLPRGAALPLNLEASSRDRLQG